MARKHKLLSEPADAGIERDSEECARPLEMIRVPRAGRIEDDGWTAVAAFGLGLERPCGYDDEMRCFMAVRFDGRSAGWRQPLADAETTRPSLRTQRSD